MIEYRHEFVCRNRQDEKPQVENRIDDIKIPFKFVFKLPSLQKARTILQRDQLGHIVSSVVSQAT